MQETAVSLDLILEGDPGQPMDRRTKWGHETTDLGETVKSYAQQGDSSRVYIGMQENPIRRTQTVLYNMGQFTRDPRGEHDFIDLARHSLRFLWDVLDGLRRGFVLRMSSSTLDMDQSYELLMKSIMTRISHLAEQGAYKNPTTPECRVFYSALKDMDGRGLDTITHIRNYERISGYDFRPQLLRTETRAV